MPPKQAPFMRRHAGGGNPNQPSEAGPSGGPGHRGPQQHSHGGGHGHLAAAATGGPQHHHDPTQARPAVVIVNEGRLPAANAASPTTPPLALPKLPPRRIRDITPATHPQLAAQVAAGECVIGVTEVVSWTAPNAYCRGSWGTRPDVLLTLDGSTPMALPGDVIAVKLAAVGTWEAPSCVDEEQGEGLHDPLSPVVATGALDRQRLPDGREVVRVLKHAERPATSVVSNAARRVADALGAPVDAPRELRWPQDLQPKGEILSILERRFERLHPCRFFSTEQDGNPVRMLRPERWYRLKPYNKAFPIIAVFGHDFPSHMRQNPGEYLFLVEIECDANDEPAVVQKFPKGRIVQALGRTGQTQAESNAIAAEFEVSSETFSEEVEACVVSDFVIPPPDKLLELGRRDLRETEFVCTIDPATARDLDDAISITRTAKGGYRLGVHIADVTNFVEVNSSLDQEAFNRATSVYFVERVVPMLPHKLCEDYCSLNAGTDKYAFSGIWEMDKDGQVLSEWFGQSVIRNRCRMAYEDAQRVIDGDLSGDSLKFVNEKQPREVLAKRVVQDIQIMYELAGKMRAHRKDRGAISLNKSKLKFIFDDMNSKLAPQGLAIEAQKEANWVIEEFMLHCNFRVAEKVFEFLPDSALLRRHGAPEVIKLQRFATAARRAGITIRYSGSKALAQSLDALRSHPDFDAICAMATMCMQRAEYCSTGEVQATEGDDAPDLDSKKISKKEAVKEMERQLAAEEAPHMGDFRHYALAAFAYCHFTSPIRRYADLVTHRQLLLALDIEAEVRRQRGRVGAGALQDIDYHALPHARYYLHPLDVADIAMQCNKKKELAKKAGDASTQLFLGLYMNAQRQLAMAPAAIAAAAAAAAATGSAPITQRAKFEIIVPAIVVRVKDNAFTLMASSVGLDCHVFFNSKSQKWKAVEEVSLEDRSFTIDWGVPPTAGGGAKAAGASIREKTSLFSKFLVTLRVVQQGLMKVDMLVHAPWDRDASRISQLKFILGENGVDI